MLTLIAILIIAAICLIALDRVCGDSSNDGVVLVVALVTLPVKPLLMGWDCWKDGAQRRNCGF